MPLQKAEGDAEGAEHRKYLVPALLPDEDEQPVPDNTLVQLSGGAGPGEGGVHRFLFYFSTVAADHSALRKSDLKNEVTVSSPTVVWWCCASHRQGAVRTPPEAKTGPAISVV